MEVPKRVETFGIAGSMGSLPTSLSAAVPNLQTPFGTSQVSSINSRVKSSASAPVRTLTVRMLCCKGMHKALPAATHSFIRCISSFCKSGCSGCSPSSASIAAACSCASSEWMSSPAPAQKRVQHTAQGRTAHTCKCQHMHERHVLACRYQHVHEQPSWQVKLRLPCKQSCKAHKPLLFPSKLAACGFNSRRGVGE